jgi:protein-tyrosine phosphatase
MSTLSRRFGTASQQWHVSSAGLHVREGEDMDPHSRTVLDELGAQSAGFQRRAVDPMVIDSADLIITAERRHRAEIVEMRPAAANRVFSLRQLSILAAQSAPVRAPSLLDAGAMLIEHVRAARGEVYVDPSDEDLDDPVGRPLRRFRLCGRAITRQFESVVDALNLEP